ncbi:tRNA (adenosine(37)-N6)-dimethylallyltransferase MiaA [Xylophilus ampelinus]|uniref:tRNA dimethylallyltransferase n=1 Tax=Xylophilus ampelinus TaxID=54067 RepID=A0A318SM29_9BURK|nr:tRNA (adenosine(37)-N6)-dimethylallyltransferase MiaA [Xylophilus ampelinus]MCS4508994.1 tRNA (adenosine(37)-N6)-dimethylallyltransferase MiaA [Xylophilus ampelinus]PYE79558.1 tRNA dimethylallyltransferase [Xylophilus ampelinus]
MTFPRAATAAPAPPALPVVCLAGPTAAGKTAATLAIARHLEGRMPVEVVSVDSALVYRGMDIGTAKPGAAERAAVPHHLIDIRDPLQAYSAAEFVADAERLIGEIQARGALPLLAGGTMLYFKALFDGLDDLPRADTALRATLDAEGAARGWPAMHAALATVDPVTAARLAPADSQRIQRALEVHRLTGRPLSAFHGAIKNIANGRRRTPAAALISLEPNDRVWLHARIARRFDAMLADGLIDEVKALRARGDLPPGLASMRCVGYRQVWEMLDGTATAGELRERGVAATRQLAKRQITWLRGMPARRTVAADAPDALAQVLRQVDALLLATEVAS